MTLVGVREGTGSLDSNGSVLPRSSSLTDTSVCASLVDLYSPQHELRRSDTNDTNGYTLESENAGGSKSIKYGIHEFVGHEASGEVNQFDFLNQDMKPYNALTHAGSLLTSACVMALDKSHRKDDVVSASRARADNAAAGHGKGKESRGNHAAAGHGKGKESRGDLPLYEKFVLLWREITGKATVGEKEAKQVAYCEETLRAAQTNDDVTNGIWFVMQANGSLPEGISREEVLETFYKLHFMKVSLSC
jgi:hypothetical protein